MEINLFKKTTVNGFELQFLLKERKQHKVDFILVDVREEEEYNNSRISGVNELISVSEFNTHKIEDHKQKPIILYCRSGVRSFNIQQALQTKGYKHTINLEGGIIAYKGEIDR